MECMDLKQQTTRKIPRCQPGLKAYTLLTGNPQERGDEARTSRGAISMGDLGHELGFGCFLTPSAQQANTLIQLARFADQIELDFMGIQDHPYQSRFLETWTLLSALARETERIRLMPDVLNLPLRPPAVLARAAASL